MAVLVLRTADEQLRVVFKIEAEGQQAEQPGLYFLSRSTRSTETVDTMALVVSISTNRCCTRPSVCTCTVSILGSVPFVPPVDKKLAGTHSNLVYVYICTVVVTLFCV